MANEKSNQAEAKPEAKAAAGGKGKSPWIMVIILVVLVPAISFGLTQFVIIPKLKAAVEPASASNAGGGEKHEAAKGKAAEGKGTFSYEFSGIVVNLSGSMGTRYLKVTFTVFSGNQDLQKIITDNKPQLLDVALGVLSSRTLADLEAGGAKNLIRNDLMSSFNQALNSDVISQIYFSEFVVQ